jgi:hypothetical protein
MGEDGGSMKNPSFPFYPSDWARDMDDQDLEIEGAWIRICGRLWWLDGVATKSLREWANILRKPLKKTEKILKFLLKSGISSGEFLDNQNITIVSRRIVKTVNISKLRQAVGKKGGNPALVKSERGLLNQESNQTSNQKGGLSFSSSFSSSVKAKKEKENVKRKRSFTSAEVTLTPEFIKYATTKGFNNGQVEGIFEAFKDYHTANNSTFLDWAAAWRLWIGNEIKFHGKPEKKLW